MLLGKKKISITWKKKTKKKQPDSEFYQNQAVSSLHSHCISPSCHSLSMSCALSSDHIDTALRLYLEDFFPDS